VDPAAIENTDIGDYLAAALLRHTSASNSNSAARAAITAFVGDSANPSSFVIGNVVVSPDGSVLGRVDARGEIVDLTGGASCGKASLVRAKQNPLCPF
jgi:hypothetical protein